MAGQGKVEIQVNAKDNASPQIKTIGKSIESMGKTFTNVGKGMMAVGAGIVGGIGAMVNSYADAGETIHDLSIKTGFSTESLSEWKYVAEQSGLSMEQIELAIKNMSLSMADAATGTGSSADAIKSLGINIDDLMKMSPEKQFDTLTTALTGVKDQTDLVSAASDIFGTKVGVDLLPMITQGKDAITGLKDEADKLNLVFSDDAATAASDFNASKDKLIGSLDGIKNAIATSVMPTISDLIEKLTNGLKPILEWIKDNPKVFEGILKVGGLILGAGGALYAFGKLISILKELRLTLISTSAFMGPAGWANLLAGVAAMGVAYSAIKVIEGVTGEASSGQEAPTSELRQLYDAANAAKGTENEYSAWQAFNDAYKAAGSPAQFASGGTVPGERGKPVMVMAHGGETFGGLNNSYRGGMGGGTNVTVNVYGSVTSERDLIQTIREELYKIQSRNSSLGFV